MASAVEESGAFFEISDPYSITSANYWSTHACHCLIKNYLKYRPLLKPYRKRIVFFLISTKLKEININKNAQECNIKLFQLTKQYQQYFEQKARGEVLEYGLPFESEMTEILDDSNIEVATDELKQELESIETQYSNKRSNKDSEEQSKWFPEAVEALLELYKKYRCAMKYGKCRSRVIFELISTKMKQRNYHFSGKFCNQKINNLMMHYRSGLPNTINKFAFDEEIHELIYQQNMDPPTIELLDEIKEFEVGLDESFKIPPVEVVWTKDNTFNLIKVMQKYRPMIMKESVQKYKYSDVFQLIAYKLETFGIFQTAKRIRIKFDNMQRTYKIIEKKHDRKALKFPFFSAMEKMYKINETSVVTKEMDAELMASMERYEMEALIEKDEIDDNIHFEIEKVEFLDEQFLDFEADTKFSENQSMPASIQQNVGPVKIMNESSEDDEPFLSELLKMDKLDRSEESSDSGVEKQKFTKTKKRKAKKVKKNSKRGKTSASKTNHSSFIKAVWTDHDTTQLLEMYGRYQALFEQSYQQKSYIPSDVYELISQRLLDKKVHRSGAKCCEKINNLNKTFRICLKSPHESHSKFKYLKMLKKIHSDKKTARVNDEMEDEVLTIWKKRQGQDKILGVSRKDPVAEPTPTIEFLVDEEDISNEPEDKTNDNISSTNERTYWGVKETERFIQLYTENYEERLSSGFWTMLSNKLKEEKFEQKSDVALKQKFSNLRRSFKICTARNKFRRIRKFKFNYFDLMETALNPRSITGNTWTEKQTNALIKAFSQVDPFSTDNLFDKVSTILGKRYIQRRPKECAARWKQLTDDMKLFKKTGVKNQSFKYFDAIVAAQNGEELVPTTNLSESLEAVKHEELETYTARPFNFIDIGTGTIIKEEVNETFLTNNTLEALINLKYEYSLQMKKTSWEIPLEIWKRFAEQLNIFLAPASLKFHFYSLLKKYKVLKMQHQECGGSIKWIFFNTFETAFGNEALNMDGAIQDLQLSTNEKVQYVIDHFMEICKVCLEPCENMTKLDSSENHETVTKINFLFYDKDSTEQLDPNVNNLICSQCMNNVEMFYNFKKQFNSTSNLLKEVDVVAPLNTNETHDYDEDFEEQKSDSEQVHQEVMEVSAEAEKDEEEELEVSPNKTMYHMVDGKKRRQRDGICDVCGIYSKNLGSHLITHSTAKKYICSHCGKKFLRREACRIHIKTHLQIRDFHCQSCSKTFTSIQCLKKHQAVHNKGVVRHTCDVCGFGCYLYSKYVVHRGLKHGIGLNHVCEICQKGFLYPKGLKYHMNIHNQTKDHKCEFCSKTFTLRASMRNHTRLVHIKGQKCPHCEKSFAYPKMLKDHIEKDH